jgi:hypothetical protein
MKSTFHSHTTNLLYYESFWRNFISFKRAFAQKGKQLIGMEEKLISPNDL